jgi:hypothetical protein
VNSVVVFISFLFVTAHWGLGFRHKRLSVWLSRGTHTADMTSWRVLTRVSPSSAIRAAATPQSKRAPVSSIGNPFGGWRNLVRVFHFNSNDQVI